MEKHEMAEKLVEKCGISYEEAAQVLKEANFDLLEAMIILERQGRLNSNNQYKYTTGIMSNYTSSADQSAFDAESFGEFIKLSLKKLWASSKNLLQYYVVISSNGRDVFSIPLIIALFLLICSAGMLFAAVIVSLIMGCSYRIVNNKK